MKAGGANEKPLAAHVSLKVAAVPERGEGLAFPGFSEEGLSPWACLLLGSTQEAPQQGNRQGGAARGGVWEPGLASYHCPTHLLSPQSFARQAAMALTSHSARILRSRVECLEASLQVPVLPSGM